jgi:hypothetical protein
MVMSVPEPEAELFGRRRPSEVVSIRIPVDTLAAIKKVAARQDIPYEALIKYYIGRGLREDLAQQMYDRVLEIVPEVLARHIDSEAEIEAVLAEIRKEAVE